MQADRRTRRLTLVATALGSSLAFLDTTVVVVALPSMEEDLGLGLAGQQWVYLAYALTLSGLYLLSGAVGDRVGLRRAFVGGVVMFAAASLVCAVASTGGMLIAGRALQGVGGAVLTTTSLALLRVVWAGEAGRAIGLWTSLTSVATIGGPPLGGVVVEAISWRWVFFLNLPFAATAIALALVGRGAGEETGGRSTLDVVGAVLSAVGLVGLTFALVEARSRGLVEVLPAAVIGVACLVAFGLWTARVTNPLVPPRLLRLPGILAANAVTIVVYAALAAQLLFLPVYLQFVGLSPTVASLAFTPPGLALVLLAPRFGRIADRRGPRLPIAAGAAVIACGVLLLLPVEDEASAWRWLPISLLVFAVGLAAVVAPITAAALGPAPPDLAGVASGLNQTASRVGGIVSVAALGALAGAVFAAAGGDGSTPFDPSLAGGDREAGVEAFHAVLAGIALLALTGSALAASLLGRRDPAAR